MNPTHDGVMGALWSGRQTSDKFNNIRKPLRFCPNTILKKLNVHGDFLTPRGNVNMNNRVTVAVRSSNNSVKVRGRESQSWQVLRKIADGRVSKI